MTCIISYSIAAMCADLMKRITLMDGIIQMTFSMNTAETKTKEKEKQNKTVSV